MTYRDAIRSRFSLQSATEAFHDGRMPARDFGRYYRLWVWSIGRFGGSAAIELDRWYETHGRASYERRQQRAVRIVKAILA